MLIINHENTAKEVRILSTWVQWERNDAITEQGQLVCTLKPILILNRQSNRTPLL